MDLERMSREDLIEALRVLLEAKPGEPERPPETARLLHDLQVHQVELEIQNRELREAQGALEQSRNRFQELYDFAPVAYFTFDAGGCVQEVNLTGATLVGRERARILGQPFLDLVRVEPPSAFWEHLERSASVGRALIGEMQIVARRLGARDVQVVTVPVLDEGGRAVAFRTSFMDITARKQAEVALERSRREEEHLRKAFEALDLASVALSRALARGGGVDRQELLQTIADHAGVIGSAEYAAIGAGGDLDAPFSTWIWSGMDRDRAALLGHAPRPRGVLGEVIRTGQAIRLRDLHTHPAFCGFPPRHAEMRSFLGVPVRFGERVMGHLFLTNRRWTGAFSEQDQRLVELFAERAGIALEIARLGEEVRSAVRARDDVLAVVSHDLRNPLAAVRLSAAQLARKLEGAEAERNRKRLDVILRATERMVHLIDALLDAATIERGTFTVEPRPEPVAPILDETLAAHEALAAARSIELRLEAPPDLPPVLCDRQRLLQVFANLIGNAIKFAHEGGRIEVCARVEAREVRFEVKDDGPGIPADKVVRLFERYWRGQREVREGVGLGLFIARGIVLAHGGRMGVESMPGVGSTFHFTIPIAADGLASSRVADEVAGA